MVGSTFQTSPASRIRVGQPALVAAWRSEPAGPGGTEDQLGAEGAGQLGQFGNPQVGAHVGEVGPPYGRGVQVDPEIGAQHDLVVDDPGQAPGQAAAARAGEAAVQIAAVGEVALLALEPEHVDHRHHDQAAGNQLEGPVHDDAADGSRAVDLVAVHGAGDEHRGTGRRTPPDEDRDADVHARVTLADHDADLGFLAGADGHIAPFSHIGPACGHDSGSSPS
jgi:hypothetical protein